MPTDLCAAIAVSAFTAVVVNFGAAYVRYRLELRRERVSRAPWP